MTLFTGIPSQDNALDALALEQALQRLEALAPDKARVVELRFYGGLSIEEAASIDGCSQWQTLWKVIFPIALPGVFTSAIMTFIAAWNEYLLTMTLNANKEFQTVPVAINALRTQFSILWGEITAATIVVVIPTLIIVLLFQKQIVSGMTAGAVKE